MTFPAVYSKTFGMTLVQMERRTIWMIYGGWQIEYEDEDPIVRQTFEQECARSGALVKMPPVSRQVN